MLEGLHRVRRPPKLPVVLAREEVEAVLRELSGQYRLMADLLYGSGLRLMECLRLRVKDVDFGYAKITVRDGKGAKDRVTMLPINLAASLQRHLQKVQAQFERGSRERSGRCAFAAMHWPGNIPTRSGNGVGNGSSLRRDSRAIRVRKRRSPHAGGAITSKRARCKTGGEEWRSALRGSRNRRLVIRCGTRLRPIYSRMAMTFGRCRSCSGTRMFRPP